MNNIDFKSDELLISNKPRGGILMIKRLVIIAIVLISHFNVFAKGNMVVEKELSLAKIELNITWDNGDPVVGARVYNHIPNVFLGETNKEGTLVFTAKVGTVIRMVEPQYGRQQNLREVTEMDVENAKDIIRWIEGWQSL